MRLTKDGEIHQLKNQVTALLDELKKLREGHGCTACELSDGYIPSRHPKTYDQLTGMEKIYWMLAQNIDATVCGFMTSSEPLIRAQREIGFTAQDMRDAANLLKSLIGLPMNDYLYHGHALGEWKEPDYGSWGKFQLVRTLKGYRDEVKDLRRAYDELRSEV